MASRVAIVRCQDYDPPAVYDAIKKALDLLGGIQSYIAAGDVVLLKPNVFGIWGPEKAATTHPTIVEAVVQLVKDARAIPQIGESSAGSAYGKTQQALQRAGIAEVAHKTSVELINFDESEKQNRYLEIIDREIMFAKPVIEADAIISLPKLKTHGLTGISGAIKNMYGTIPGPAKSQLHKEFPDRQLFAKAIVAICAAVRPRLSIMDGIMAMEGTGPATGPPKNLGIILVSDDPVAMDTVVVNKIMHIPAQHIAMLQSGADAQLGTNNMEEIEILGDALESGWLEQKFRPPISYALYSSRWIPQVLKSTLMKKFNRAATPRITKNCTGCGDCVDACPTNAIQVARKGGKDKKALIVSEMCISCFCCHESCRHAGVEIHLPLLWRIAKQ